MSMLTSKRRLHTLSFAIDLIDDYSKEKIREGVKFLLNDRDFYPVRNPSSFYTFLNLPDGTYILKVIDESKRYFDQEWKIDKPFEIISLMPKPYNYTFPPNETLLCGVLRQNGLPISGATIKGKVSERSFSGRTDELGRFVIYFGILADMDIVTENNIKYVKGMDQGTKIDITIEYSVGEGQKKEYKKDVDKIEVGVNNIRNLMISI